VDPVLVEKVDHISLQPLQRGFGHFHNVSRAAIESRLLTAFYFETELGGDDHLIAKRGQRFAKQFLVSERPVDFGGIEKRYTAPTGPTDNGDHFVFPPRRAVSEPHPHTAKAECKNLKAFSSEFSFLHIESPSLPFSDFS